jgi:hypothetical protein
MQIFSHPYKGVDMHEDYEDWSMDALRARTDLICAFDQLADDIVAEAVRLAENSTVEEEINYVPVKKSVMVMTGE